MGFNYLTFQLSEHTQVPMSWDKQGSTVPKNFGITLIVHKLIIDDVYGN